MHTKWKELQGHYAAILPCKNQNTTYLFSLDAESVAAAMERVMSCPDIKHHVDKMAAILRTRKESPAKVTFRVCSYSKWLKFLPRNLKRRQLCAPILAEVFQKVPVKLNKLLINFYIL